MDTRYAISQWLKGSAVVLGMAAAVVDLALGRRPAPKWLRWAYLACAVLIEAAALAWPPGADPEPNLQLYHLMALFLLLPGTRRGRRLLRMR